MAPRNNGAKPKRQKKNKSRTEVSDASDSEIEVERESTPTVEEKKKKRAGRPKEVAPGVASSSSSSSAESTPEPNTPKRRTDAQIHAKFTQFYLSQATKEFEDDLDRLRNAEDFKDEHLGLLVEALRQGTGLFEVEEMRRVVEAGEEN